ncbi:ABC transporter substrate-binding protein [Thalassotalea euphylliae]|uniref:Extracellular solute-binding protein n=1 Tax=Thalassotalea euphylliae TaxID=1655234 RepID=A0A3E0UC33_9GAMM|nr:extracellular solute-binding protein [Thalassotalea euphylliae]REL34400.1 extracellular solute-binding protein [Thalassotalea euphylliae]
MKTHHEENVQTAVKFVAETSNQDPIANTSWLVAWLFIITLTAWLSPITADASVVSDNASRDLISEPKEALPKEKASATLNVAVLYSTPGHRSLFEGVREEFEQHHPDITLNFTGLVDASYKQALVPWLESGEMDVLYWQAGERLKNLVRQDLLLPLTELWQSQQFDQAFPETVKNLVSVNQEVYAIPYSFYTWGLFYNKPLLEKLAISPPKNWAELLRMCEKISKAGKVPIMIGSGDPWLPAAWFDYIDLRLNGLAFHQALLAGEIAYTDQRVRSVFTHWQQLIEANCFNSDHQLVTWRDMLPPLYRQMTAMTLLGNFFDNHVPTHLAEDLGFMPFPTINSKIAQFENVPTDVVVVARKTKHAALAMKFLRFIAQPEIQSKIASAIGQSSPHLKASKEKGHFARLNKPVLASAVGLDQYFDRGVSQSMVGASLAIFAEFIEVPNVERATAQLEQLRLKNLKSSNKDSVLSTQ